VCGEERSREGEEREYWRGSDKGEKSLIFITLKNLHCMYSFCR
jgi:hypothetical protein